MDIELFEKYRKLIYRESGIVLGPEKLYLLVNRIQKRLKELKISDEKHYLKIIEVDATGEELVKLIDAISTNLTYFYREPQHFAILRKLIKQFQDEQRSELKFWCTAASSGEEPYNIALETKEAIGNSNQSFRLLASDICTKVLNKAVLGIYSTKTVEKIPLDLRNKYFNKIIVSDEEQWQAKPELAQAIIFKKFNLVKFPYQLNGNFDIIFCRNVMIYFDLPTRNKIVNELYRLLRPGGYLIISLSESLLGLETKFEKYEGSVFVKKGIRC